MPATDEAQIARVAHSLWEAEGRPDGRDKEHWSRAERLLAGRAENPPEKPSAPGPSRAETPGPRDPAPIPATNAAGFVAIPSVDENAAMATSDDPVPPREPTKTQA